MVYKLICIIKTCKHYRIATLCTQSKCVIYNILLRRENKLYVTIGISSRHFILPLLQYLIFKIAWGALLKIAHLDWSNLLEAIVAYLVNIIHGTAHHESCLSYLILDVHVCSIKENIAQFVACEANYLVLFKQAKYVKSVFHSECHAYIVGSLLPRHLERRIAKQIKQSNCLYNLYCTKQLVLRLPCLSLYTLKSHLHRTPLH